MPSIKVTQLFPYHWYFFAYETHTNNHCLIEITKEKARNDDSTVFRVRSKFVKNGRIISSKNYGIRETYNDALNLAEQKHMGQDQGPMV